MRQGGVFGFHAVSSPGAELCVPQLTAMCTQHSTGNRTRNATATCPSSPPAPRPTHRLASSSCRAASERRACFCLSRPPPAGAPPLPRRSRRPWLSSEPEPDSLELLPLEELELPLLPDEPLLDEPLLPDDPLLPELVPLLLVPLEEVSDSLPLLLLLPLPLLLLVLVEEPEPLEEEVSLSLPLELLLLPLSELLLPLLLLEEEPRRLRFFLPFPSSSPLPLPLPPAPGGSLSRSSGGSSEASMKRVRACAQEGVPAAGRVRAVVGWRLLGGSRPRQWGSPASQAWCGWAASKTPVPGLTNSGGQHPHSPPHHTQRSTQPATHPPHLPAAASIPARPPLQHLTHVNNTLP